METEKSDGDQSEITFHYQSNQNAPLPKSWQSQMCIDWLMINNTVRPGIFLHGKKRPHKRMQLHCNLADHLFANP